MKKTISLFLLCAGGGIRLQKSKPKALCILNKKEIFLHSLIIFLKVKEINNFYLVIDKKYKKTFQEILKREKIKNVNIVFGSSVSRHDSLRLALKQTTPKETDIIITHDSARTNITKEIIKKNIYIAKKYKFASTQIPLVDSLFKKCNECYEIYPRENLFLIQTPQTFEFSLWKNKKSKIKNVTDLFSFLNIRVKEKNIVKGSVKNYKITFKEDLN